MKMLRSVLFMSLLISSQAVFASDNDIGKQMCLSAGLTLSGMAEVIFASKTQALSGDQIMGLSLSQSCLMVGSGVVSYQLKTKSLRENVKDSKFWVGAACITLGAIGSLHNLPEAQDNVEWIQHLGIASEAVAGALFGYAVGREK